MSIYRELLNGVEANKKFKIDLNKKNLSVGGKEYIKGGELCVEESLIDKGDLDEYEIDVDDGIEAVKDLYTLFKYSTPSASRKGVKSYFLPLSLDELSDADLAYGLPRYYAMAMLEGYVLLAGMAGKIKWENESHYFWQDEFEKDLILFKNWVC